MNQLPPSISIVMRSKDEGWAIRNTLEAIKNQDYTGKIELIVVDSGSTDGSVEIIEEFNPAIFHQIFPQSYVPGKVLNWGLDHSSNDWVVFLNADATPANNEWLSELLTAGLNCMNFGVMFSRQIPRSNCCAVFAHDYERCFGPQRESVTWDHFFSMVSCLVNKPVWAKYRFREDLQYAEDDEWSRRLKSNGFEIGFVEKSIAIHSHNYTIKQSFRRSKGDMVALTQAGSMKPKSISLIYDTILGAISDIMKDINYHFKVGAILQIPFAIGIRFAQRLGKRSGNHAVK